MSFKRKTDSLLTNGSDRLAKISAEEPMRFRYMNERTFSLSLFVLSLTIVLGKLFVNYGKLLQWQINDQYTVPSVTSFTQIYNTIGMSDLSILPIFDMKQLPANSDKFLNASNQYAKAAANVLVVFYENYGWFIKAIISGCVITSFTWFIIYNDSSVPGVNPPSPFSPRKQRVLNSSRLQMNYFVGILNGVLFFIYMCL